MSSRNPSRKRPASAESSWIKLTVKSQDGSKLFFNVRRDTQLKMLMHNYELSKPADAGTFRFLINGKRCNTNQTFDELGLEDGDEIDALMEMGGGGCQRTT